MEAPKKDILPAICLKNVPAWIVARARMDAARRGENGYGKAIIRALEEHYNKQEEK